MALGLGAKSLIMVVYPKKQRRGVFSCGAMLFGALKRNAYGSNTGEFI